MQEPVEYTTAHKYSPFLESEDLRALMKTHAPLRGFVLPCECTGSLLRVGRLRWWVGPHAGTHPLPASSIRLTSRAPYFSESIRHVLRHSNATRANVDRCLVSKTKAFDCVEEGLRFTTYQTKTRNKSAIVPVLIPDKVKVTVVVATGT